MTRPHGPHTSRAAAARITHDRIVAEARRRFTADGFEGVTVRAVAGALRLSTGAVMSHFATKADLWAATMAVTPGAQAFTLKVARIDTRSLIASDDAPLTLTQTLCALVNEAQAIVGKAALRTPTQAAA